MSFEKLIQSLTGKLVHTEQCVLEIQKAIYRQGVLIDDQTPLREYAPNILLIAGGVAESARFLRFEFQDFLNGVDDSVDIIYPLITDKHSSLKMTDEIKVLRVSKNNEWNFVETLLKLSDSVNTVHPLIVDMGSGLKITDDVKVSKFQNIINKEFSETVLSVVDRVNAIHPLQRTIGDSLNFTDMVESIIPKTHNPKLVDTLSISDTVTVEIILK